MTQFVLFAFVCVGYSNWGQFAISIVFNATSVGRVREYKRAAAGEMVFTKDISLLLHFLFKIFSFNKKTEAFHYVSTYYNDYNINRYYDNK